MKNLPTFEDFLNEQFSFKKIDFNSHENHNPDCDILEGYLDSDTYITYGIYIKSTKLANKGDEFMELYTGSNYVPGSNKKSHSRMFKAENVPSKYKNAWESLKKIYEDKYKNNQLRTPSCLGPRRPRY